MENKNSDRDFISTRILNFGLFFLLLKSNLNLLLMKKRLLKGPNIVWMVSHIIGRN